LSTREINHDYDAHNDGRAIDWREHTGLCSKIARGMTKRNRLLESHFEDIVNDLHECLWQCTLPGKFDPTKGIRFSTYACRAMIRRYRQICMIYLGYNPSNKHTNAYAHSLNVPLRRGGSMEIIDTIETHDPDPMHADDLRVCMEIVMEIAGEYFAGNMIDASFRGQGSIVRSYGSSARRQTRKRIEEVRETDPDLIEQIELVIGMAS